MSVPSHLRAYASLEQEVLIIGMINRVELWAPTTWSAKELDALRGASVAG
jgi:MraZ protein